METAIAYDIILKLPTSAPLPETPPQPSITLQYEYPLNNFRATFRSNSSNRNSRDKVSTIVINSTAVFPVTYVRLKNISAAKTHCSTQLYLNSDIIVLCPAG